MQSVSEKDIWNKAIQLLARREYSYVELASKLVAFAGDLDVEPVMARLLAEGYQSDRRFVESFIRMRISQGHGLIRIRFDLKRKGVAAELIAELLESMQVDWFELALEQYRRKYRAKLDVADYKEKNKRMRYLSQRGFSFDEIQYVLDASADESIL